MDGRIDHFEQLEVWQTGRELVRGVYRAAQSQPLKDDLALLNQMKRAAISVPSNIAEGFERGTRKQQIESCYVAKGSVGELRTQVLLAHDVGLLDKVSYAWLLERCDKCARQLARYLRHLKQTQARIRGAKFVEQERVGRASAGDSDASGAGRPTSDCRPSRVPTSPLPHVPTGPEHGS
jgi:four helix bundle protein